jgi:hypothetical protein
VFFQKITVRIVIITNDTRDRNGIVINPNHSIYFVVQEIPWIQGATDSGRIW